jgi:hypothetical protein
VVYGAPLGIGPGKAGLRAGIDAVERGLNALADAT